MVKDRWFPKEGVTKYVHEALAKCIRAGYLPRVSWDSAEERISDLNSPYWQWHKTRAIIGTIRVDRELCKVVSNIPCALNSDPAYIRRILKAKKLVNGACPIPESDVVSFKSTEGKRDENGNLLCSIKPLSEWHKAGSGFYSFERGLIHPMSEPTFGTDERARNYSNALRQKGRSNIGFLFADESEDLARPLAFGGYYVNVGGNNDFNVGGRFVGVSFVGAEGNAKKLRKPTLREIIDLARSQLPPEALLGFNKVLKNDYGIE